MKRILSLSFLLGAFVVQVGTLKAAEFSLDDSKGAVNVVLTGTIQEGDSEKLVQLVQDSPREFMRVASLTLRSNGGSVLEAVEIAKLI